MKLIVIFLAALAAWTTPAVPKPHKFEDGFVERTMAVIVRGEIAHVEYSIGLNENTAREIVMAWEADSNHSRKQLPSDNLSANQYQNDPVVKQPELQSVNTPPMSPHPNSRSTPAGNSATAGNPIEPNGTDDSTSHSKTNSTDKSTDELAVIEGNANNEGDSNPKKSDHYITPDVLEKLKTLSPTAITSGLDITCDGKPVNITGLMEGITPRHPFTLTVKFHFALPESKSCDLDIRDTNFTKQTGAIRLALKASGKTMLLRSNVAPIIVRSERVELANLEESQRAAQASIVARLAVIASSKE